eukprot:scaffold16890_cov110-Isochrysis_galbana.AAC.7
MESVRSVKSAANATVTALVSQVTGFPVARGGDGLGVRGSRKGRRSSRGDAVRVCPGRGGPPHAPAGCPAGRAVGGRAPRGAHCSSDECGLRAALPLT